MNERERIGKRIAEIRKSKGLSPGQARRTDRYRALAI